MQLLTIACFSWVVMSTTSALGQLASAPGFSTSSALLNDGTAFVGGMCPLPDGRVALFDGQAVVAIDLDTQQSTTIHLPGSFVFGAFLVIEPNGAALYFGESSFGTITHISLPSGIATTIATVPLVYDAEFSPNGDLFLTRGSPTWTATEIVKLDLASGSVDVIASAPGPSGPLAFDDAGNLHYGENSPLFPAPLGSGKIWKWDAEQVESAIGPSTLSLAQATSFATGLDAITDLAFDDEGDLAISDSIHGRLYALTPLGAVHSVIADVSSGGVTYLAFRDDSTGSVARFDPFQPPTGGELLAIAGDHSTYTTLSRIRPRRATLDATPPSPIPSGPFTLAMNDGSPFAHLHLFVATSAVPEFPVFALGTPLFFGLAPGSILPLPPFSLNSAGGFALGASHPGVAVTAHLQAVLVDPFVGPLGTTPVVSISFQ